MELPRPDLLETSPSPKQVCLITNDGTSLTQELVSALERDGWEQIVILSLPETQVTPGPVKSEKAQTVLLKAIDEPSLKKILEQISKDNGPVTSFIHLHPQIAFDRSVEERFSDVEKQILKLTFLIAKHLSGALVDAATGQRSVFMTITRINGKLGYDPDSEISPVAGGLNGLVKTANIEWEPVFCRALDLSPEIEASEAAKLILAEMSDSDTRISETGYTTTKRYTLIAEEQTAAEIATDSGIEESNVFLVAGGGKGVTAACVKEMARRYKCRFILLGRSEIPESEPEWAENCDDDTELKKRCMEAFKAAGEKPTPMKIATRLKQILAGREIQTTLREIQEAGAQAAYVSVDIHNSKLLKSKLKPVVETLGEISGIIHGAGVLADKLIEKKTEEDFEAVYTTKISGLNTLLDAVSEEKLSHLILFSSAAGFYGNEAQSDYAAANEILNKFSHLFKQRFPSCHVIAYNWGPWDGGMVTPALKSIFEQRKIDIIPIPVGASMMADGLNPVYRSIPQVVIGSSMTIPSELTDRLESYRIRRNFVPASNRFLNDHTIDGEPVLPFISAISWMADSCACLYPGYHLHSFENAQVYKGVVFTNQKGKDFNVDVKEIEKDAAEGRVRFDVRISSKAPKGKSVNHYGSQILLSRHIDSVPIISVGEINSEIDRPATELYENGTLFHGPIFQSVTTLRHIDEEKLIIGCHTPLATEKIRGQFGVNLFNFFAEDTCLQALLIWARHFHDAGSLPLKIQKGEFFKAIPFSKDYLITLVPENSTPSKITATVTAHSETGEVYSRFYGAEAVISKNLDGKFKR